MTDLNARLAEVQRELADSFAAPDADDNDGHAMALECERRDILAELAAREATEATRRGATTMSEHETLSYAWDLGYGACLRGAVTGHNPYRTGDPRHASWIEGYRYCATTVRPAGY